MSKKIGVIDSGIGGLTLVQEMARLKLDCEVYYCCDHKNVPYGDKSQEFMLSSMDKMIDNLANQRIKHILIACNTLTVTVIEQLRNKHSDIIFVGIEPYINYINKTLEKESQNIGLILTPATYKSERFKFLKETYDTSNRVKIIPLKNLALLIEENYFNKDKDFHSKIESELSPLRNLNLSELILGCTHYPLVKDIIEDYLEVKTIDPHLHVIKQLQTVSQLNENKGFESINFSADCGASWDSKSLNT